MSAYYNELDAHCAAWLRELIREGLIADGEVDERDIRDVESSDLRGFVQCHWFAGIGGWPLALRLAGWRDDEAIWTGSCPCTPHSSAARGRNVEPDIWPYWREHIAVWRPRTLASEQVANDLDWFDAVRHDLENLGYAVGLTVLPACSVGLDHARQRLFFVGHADTQSEPVLRVDAEMAGVSRHRRFPGGVVSKDGVSRDMVALAGFGNAIVPALGAEVIRAYMQIVQLEPSVRAGTVSR